MISQSAAIRKFSLSYGLVLGGLGIVFYSILYLQNLYTSQNPWLMNISNMLAVIVTFWGIFSFKKARGGVLKLKEALKIGVGIALISGLLSILYNIILVNYIDPEVPSKLIEARLGSAIESGKITWEQFEERKAQGLNFWWMGYPVILVFNILMGLVLGLVAGFMFRTSKNTH